VEEHYDLVVVGAGNSGLAAAYFYRQCHQSARILVLDTRDDFGGHAKRNEFIVDGRRLIGRRYAKPSVSTYWSDSRSDTGMTMSIGRR
jgi:cation diffusion facilitator CzcD-associated flavoprotein CzcO